MASTPRSVNQPYIWIAHDSRNIVSILVVLRVQGPQRYFEKVHKLSQHKCKIEWKISGALPPIGWTEYHTCCMQIPIIGKSQSLESLTNHRVFNKTGAHSRRTPFVALWLLHAWWMMIWLWQHWDDQLVEHQLLMPCTCNVELWHIWPKTSHTYCNVSAGTPSQEARPLSCAMLLSLAADCNNKLGHSSPCCAPQT